MTCASVTLQPSHRRPRAPRRGPVRFEWWPVRPDSENSRRVLGIGDLAGRYRKKAAKDGAKPDSWVFHQKRSPASIVPCQNPAADAS